MDPKRVFQNHIRQTLKAAGVKTVTEHAWGPYEELNEALRALTENRAYHNHAHFNKMFEIAKLWQWELEPYEQLAIIFHDAIYNPLANLECNERDSIALMRAFLTQHVDNEILNRASDAIRATAYHFNYRLVGPAAKGSGLRVVDLDLASAITDLRSATAGVRIELRHARPESEWDEKGFVRNRIAFLRTIATRKHVYHSFDDHDKDAREALVAEIKRLGG